MTVKTFEDVYAIVAEKNKISKADFKKRVDDKLEAFGGICDNFTGAVLVAGDMGVSLDTGAAKPREQDLTKIVMLTPGSANVSFRCVVLSKQPPKTFQRKNGEGEGRLVSVTGGDETGKIRITAWDDKADDLDQFQVGDPVMILHAYTRDGFQGGVEANVGYKGLIQTCDTPVTYKPKTVKIEHLEDGMTTGVKGVVTGVDGMKEFTRKNGQPGRLCPIWLSDETGRTRVTFWDNYADEAAALNVGEAILVPEARAKPGYQGGGVELSSTGGFLPAGDDNSSEEDNDGGKKKKKKGG
jgi:replication factor A1